MLREYRRSVFESIGYSFRDNAAFCCQSLLIRAADIHEGREKCAGVVFELFACSRRRGGKNLALSALLEDGQLVFFFIFRNAAHGIHPLLEKLKHLRVN